MKSIQEITILGHRGGYLSLIFENLTANSYPGNVNIILNESEKKDLLPFKTNISFAEFFYTEFQLPLKTGFIFCGNSPVTKIFLFNFYEKIWQIKPDDFVQSIHPSSVIASTVIKGAGLQIEPLSVVAPYTKIGFGVNIGRNCSVGHHNVLDNYCSIHFGSNLASSVEVGKGTVIGPGCTIFSGIKIGKNTIIGGGSVVTKDISSNVLAFGNPCRIIKKLN